MSGKVERVNHLLIKSKSKQSVVQARNQLEEAFQMASFPGVPSGSLVFVKQLLLAGIKTNESVISIVQQIEGYFARNVRKIVNIDVRDTHNATAVWFSDEITAWVRLLENICLSQANQWYWSLVIPYLLSKSSDQAIRQQRKIQALISGLSSRYSFENSLTPSFILQAVAQLYGVDVHRKIIVHFSRYSKLDSLLEHVERKDVLPFLPFYPISQAQYSLVGKIDCYEKPEKLIAELPNAVLLWIKKWGSRDIRSYWLMQHTIAPMQYASDIEQYHYLSICLKTVCQDNPPDENKPGDNNIRFLHLISDDDQSKSKSSKAQEGKCLSKENKPDWIKKNILESSVKSASYDSLENRSHRPIIDADMSSVANSEPQYYQTRHAISEELSSTVEKSSALSSSRLLDSDFMGLDQAGFSSDFAGIFYLITLLNSLYEKNHSQHLSHKPSQLNLQQLTLYFVLRYYLKCKDSLLLEALGFDGQQCDLMDTQLLLNISNYLLPEQWKPYYRRTDFTSLDQLIIETIKAIVRLLLRNKKLSLKRLLKKKAIIVASHTHIDVTYDAADIDESIRYLGLDSNPGWVPWLHKVIHFEYQGQQLKTYTLDS